MSLLLAFVQQAEPIAGDLDATLADATVAASGELDIAGQGAGQLEPVTLAATGTLSQGAGEVSQAVQGGGGARRARRGRARGIVRPRPAPTEPDTEPGQLEDVLLEATGVVDWSFDDENVRRAMLLSA